MDMPLEESKVMGEGSGHFQTTSGSFTLGVFLLEDDAATFSSLTAKSVIFLSQELPFPPLGS